MSTSASPHDKTSVYHPSDRVRKISDHFCRQFNTIEAGRLRWVHQYEAIVEETWVKDWKSTRIKFLKWKAEVEQETANLDPEEAAWVRNAVLNELVDTQAGFEMSLTVGNGKEMILFRPHHSLYADRSNDDDSLFDDPTLASPKMPRIEPFISGPSKAPVDAADAYNVKTIDMDIDELLRTDDASTNFTTTSLFVPSETFSNSSGQISSGEIVKSSGDARQSDSLPAQISYGSVPEDTQEARIWEGTPLPAQLASVSQIIDVKVEVAKFLKPPISFAAAQIQKRWISICSTAAFVLECPCIDTCISARRTGPWARTATHELLPRSFHADPFGADSAAAFHFRVAHGMTFSTPASMVEQYGRLVQDEPNSPQPDGHNIAVHNLALRAWRSQLYTEWDDLCRRYRHDGTAREEPLERTVCYEDIAINGLSTFKWLNGEVGVIVCPFPDCTSSVTVIQLQQCDEVVKHFMEHGLCLTRCEDILRLFGFNVLPAVGAPIVGAASSSPAKRPCAHPTAMSPVSKKISKPPKPTTTAARGPLATPSTPGLDHHIDNFAELSSTVIREMYFAAGFELPRPGGGKMGMVYCLAEADDDLGYTKHQPGGVGTKFIKTIQDKRVVNRKLEYLVHWSDGSPGEWLSVSMMLREGASMRNVRIAISNITSGKQSSKGTKSNNSSKYWEWQMEEEYVEG